MKAQRGLETCLTSHRRLWQSWAWNPGLLAEHCPGVGTVVGVPGCCGPEGSCACGPYWLVDLLPGAPAHPFPLLGRMDSPSIPTFSTFAFSWALAGAGILGEHKVCQVCAWHGSRHMDARQVGNRIGKGSSWGSQLLGATWQLPLRAPARLSTPGMSPPCQIPAMCQEHLKENFLAVSGVQKWVTGISIIYSITNIYQRKGTTCVWSAC